MSLLAGVGAIAAVLPVAPLAWGALLLYANVFLAYCSPIVALLLLALCFVAIFAFALLVLFFAGVLLPFVAVALGNEEMSVRKAFWLSLHAAKGQKRYIFSFTLRQIPHVLLCILTIGVYYIFWYSPRFVLSYLRLSQVLFPKEESYS